MPEELTKTIEALSNEEKQHWAEEYADSIEKPGISDYWKGVVRGYLRGINDHHNIISSRVAERLKKSQE